MDRICTGMSMSMPAFIYHIHATPLALRTLTFGHGAQNFVDSGLYFTGLLVVILGTVYSALWTCCEVRDVGMCMRK